MIVPLSLPRILERTEAEVFLTFFRYYFPDADISWYRYEPKDGERIDLTPQVFEDMVPTNRFEANVATIETSGGIKGVSQDAVSILLSPTEPQIYVYEENFPPDRIGKINDAVSKSLESTAKSVVHVSKARAASEILILAFIFASILGAIYFLVIPSPILIIFGVASLVIALIVLLSSITLPKKS